MASVANLHMAGRCSCCRGIEAICIAAFGFFGSTAVSFVIADALVFLFWGDIFSLFAATVGGAFGRQYVTVNYGSCTRRKASHPCWSRSTHYTGSWHAVYAVGCGMNALAAILGFFVLKPMINARLKAPGQAEAARSEIGGAPSPA